MSINQNRSVAAETAKGATSQAQHFCDGALKDLRHHDLKFGTKLYQHALRIYLSEAEPLLERIISGIETGNHEQVRRAAHSLKSNSLLVGAALVAETAGIIERGAAEKKCLASSLGRDLASLLGMANRAILSKLQGTLDLGPSPRPPTHGSS
ncbi:MAG: Hpt domain-containing protein [Burkholderiales bacterium]